MADLLDAYYDGHAKALPSGEQARIAIGKLKPMVGSRLCEFFEFKDSKKVAEELIARRHSVSYASRTLSVLRSAFNHGRRQSLLRAAPLFYEPRTAAHMEAEPLKGRLLELDQMARLVDQALDIHSLVSMVALFNTGARIASLLEARGCQFDLERRLLWLLPGGSRRRSGAPCCGFRRR